MPSMSTFEARLCRSRPWRLFTRRVVLPWAIGRAPLSGEVLEVGAGSGDVAAELLAAHPDVRVTATDYDDEMVAAAQRTLAPFGGRAHARQADAASLPFGDGSFDAGLSFLMLHHVGRWETALAELARVVRSGGRVFVYDVLDTRVVRAAHAATRSPGLRFIQPPELRAAAAGLPLDDVRVRTSGPVFRLSGRKR